MIFSYTYMVTNFWGVLSLLHFLFSVISDVLCSMFFLSGYVSNTNSFPQPLSVEEEQKYIEAYKGGSEDARNTLIERNLRLVAHIVKKYSTFNSDSDDLISIGTIGLIKAITTFDQSKGTRLATYAARCIENAIVTQWLKRGWIMASAYLKVISKNIQSLLINATFALWGRKVFECS